MISLGRVFTSFEIGGLVALALFAVLYASLSLQSVRVRTVVILLRTFMWIMVLGLLFRPSWVQVEREVERRPLAVLVDTSASMSLPTDAGKIRWSDVQVFLAQEGIWKKLQNDFDLRFFELAEDFQPSSRESISSLKNPPGKGTHLRKAVHHWRDRSRWAGVMLVTDGVDTENSEGHAETAIGKIRIPIVSLYPAPPRNLRDAAIVSVGTPDVAFYQNRLSMDVEIEVVGLPVNQAELKVLSENRVLASQRLDRVAWNGQRASVPLSFVPDRVGPLGLTIEITQFPDEVTFENNRAFRVVKVLRDRSRVLHVGGRPSWDLRFLRSYLKENPNLDLISFFILRSPTDNPEADQKSLSLIPFPYQDLFTKELSRFDLVVFQNFDFRTYFSTFYLANIRSYVENGGAFVVIGGELSFGQGGYRHTPLEEILPVQVRDDSAEVVTAPFKPMVTPQGYRHPIISGQIRQKAVSSMPPMWGFHRIQSLQEGSVVLLAHPSEKLNGQPAPIVAVRQVGKGRVAAIMVDSMWRWAFSDEEYGPKAYRVFWNGLYRWLLQDPEFSYVKVDTAQPLVAGQDNEVQVETMRENYEPLVGVRPNLLIQGPDQNSEQAYQMSKTDAQGVARRKITPAARGLLQVQAELSSEQSGYQSANVFAIAPETHEFDRRSVDIDLLGKLAEGSEGGIVEMASAHMDVFEPFYRNATFRVIGRKEIPLCDSPIFLALLLACAGLEWWYRRRHGAS